MDTAKLTIVLETIRYGSIRKAAQVFGYTPAGLNYLLNNFEEDLGLNIIEKNSGGVAFNEHGKRLVPYFVDFLKAETIMRTAMAEIIDDARSSVRICSYGTIAACLLPEIMKSFQEAYPNISIEIKVRTDGITDCLRNGLADIAFTEQHNTGEFDWIPLWEDEIYAVVPIEHRFAQYKSIPLKFLAKEPIVFPSLNMKNIVIVKLTEMGFTGGQGVIVESSEAMTVLNMVSKGLGNTFLSKKWLPMCPKGLCMKPIDPPMPRIFGMVIKPNGSINPTNKKFIEYVKRCSN